jgi:hypothetical protein
VAADGARSGMVTGTSPETPVSERETQRQLKPKLCIAGWMLLNQQHRDP